MLPELLPVSGPEESFITELPPMEEPVCLQMLMSHVVNPSEFYVHLVTPDAGLLDVMMNDLNKFYDSTSRYSVSLRSIMFAAVFVSPRKSKAGNLS